MSVSCTAAGQHVSTAVRSRSRSALLAPFFAAQAAALHMLEALGADALDPDRRSAPVDPLHLEAFTASWWERYLRSFAGTIAGGTSQIQRNIIADRVLGLPR